MPIDPDLQAFSRPGGRTGMVLCHGFTGSPAAVRPWADAVSAAGYAISVPRLPGHGTSWQELALVPWEDWYAEIQRSYLALAADCDQVFIGGLSMGGALALRMAEHHPDVAGLVLVNPAMSAADPMARFSPVLKHLVRSVRSVGGDIKKENSDERAYDRTPVAGVAQLLALWADVRSLLDLVTCPILLYRSGLTTLFPEFGRPDPTARVLGRLHRSHAAGQLSRRNAGQRCSSHLRGHAGLPGAGHRRRVSSAV